MENTFDLKKFLVENKLTNNSKILSEVEQSVEIANNLKNLVSISGKGTKEIIITLSGAQTGTTKIISDGKIITDDDIKFI